jgi:hypothetical protein
VAILSSIRRWHFRVGVSIREIGRRTGLLRNTIKKYLSNAVVEPRYPKRCNPSKLDVAAKLVGWLKTEANKGCNPSNSPVAIQQHQRLFAGSVQFQRLIAVCR